MERIDPLEWRLRAAAIRVRDLADEMERGRILCPAIAKRVREGALLLADLADIFPAQPATRRYEKW